LEKNKAKNKQFFFGVTGNLIYYKLDDYKNRKITITNFTDEFFVIGSESFYIPVVEVKDLFSFKFIYILHLISGISILVLYKHRAINMLNPINFNRLAN